MRIDPARRRRSARWRRILFVSALAVYAATLGPVVCFAARLWWVFELATHFRLQYAWWLLAATAIFAGCGLWGPAAAAGLLLAIHAASLRPFYARPAVARGSRERQLRVLSANVRSRNRQFGKVLNLIREEKPDVALFLEVTDDWTGALAPLTEQWPFSRAWPEPGTRGIAIFSRLPFDELEVKLLGDAVRTIVARVSLQGLPLTIVAAHPYPPVSPILAKIRDRQFAELAEMLAEAQGPTVLIGDLNMTSWSPAFADLVARTGLRESRLGLGVQATWPAFLPAIARIPIDHCLVSPDLHVVARRVGPHIGSDHLPIVIDLTIASSRCAL